MPDVPIPRSLADRLKKWEQLRDKVPTVLEQTPHLREEHANFDQALKQLVLFEHEQEAATARLREATRLRDEQDNRVRLLNNRLVAGLQAHFGPESERLIEFAIPPRRRRRRRKSELPQPPTGVKTRESAN
ncbi:MAG TPA: hypothetical protein VNJ70_02480 [Thermoanaerobaculia bacterium]|nr:hypothetical protein [Thermoanaerobaculia bacterium]